MITKLSNGKWRVNVDMGRRFDGNRDRRQVTCATKKQAEQVELDLKLEREFTHGKSRQVTLGKFYEDIYKPIVKNRVRAATWDVYESHITKHVLPAFGNIEIVNIKRADIQNFLLAQKTKKIAQNARDALRQILTLAVEYEIVTYNVARGRFKFPESSVEPTQHNGEWLTTFEEHMILFNAAKGSPAEPLIVIGLSFGLRKGEILGLNWSDIDFTNREIHVQRTFVRSNNGVSLTEPKTKRSVRDIPMNDYAYHYLKALQKSRKVFALDDAVIAGWNGKRMNPETAYKTLKRFTDAHNVPKITLLSMRHSFATACINAGMNPVNVSKLLGHANVETTLNRYVRPKNKELHNEMRKADIILKACES
ncbi:MAG: site-specific integrase [Coriobacteriia bacterium]|nr:site-specific integrase [Coriobacteriia bacterium]